ncbi:MAG: septum formation inhibitor Maf [Gammaproteobacteria bacterium]|nr:septum formation inhibitor Maf [Gammaproteobacteria bacterium]
MDKEINSRHPHARLDAPLPESQLCLASASARRAELLRQINLRFTTIHCDIDETQQRGESAEQYCLRLSQEKAAAGRERIGHRLPVLGADTIVILNRQTLGKPRSSEEAVAMLLRLGNRTHQVATAVTIIDRKGESYRDISVSQVTFRAISHAEAVRYVASGEPLDKAGAYAIQGVAALFISHLEGSYSGVMGLPLYETAQLLAKVGVQAL